MRNSNLKLTRRNNAAIAQYAEVVGLTPEESHYPLCALMKLEPEELPRELREITSDVTSIPGTLYFTPEVFDQLNELCALKRLTPTQLIVEAINSQGARWEEFIAEVMPPFKPR